MDFVRFSVVPSARNYPGACSMQIELQDALLGQHIELHLGWSRTLDFSSMGYLVTRGGSAGNFVPILYSTHVLWSAGSWRSRCDRSVGTRHLSIENDSHPKRLPPRRIK